MRNSLLPLTMMALMLASAPATAQQVSQSGQSDARAQATASARIISGESIRFGASTRQVAAKQEINRKSDHIFPLARTRGRVVVDGQPQISVTEFH
ncbi:MAG: hypothetical protein ABJP02_18805 [Parasphingorhabdus sp.]|uniref:hypothetical protein n=1 Tax=Parasphingorhabdus sp. TaxID=2709688 RepID=UPI00329993AB